MKRNLSVGDAIAIIALLIFAIVWPLICTAGARSGDLDDVPTIGVLIIFVMIFGPTLWALQRINYIIRSTATNDHH